MTPSSAQQAPVRSPHCPRVGRLAAVFLLASSPLLAETEVAEFRGSESRNTPEFEVSAPWILDWRVSTDGARDTAVEVTLEKAGLGTHQGRVFAIKGPGNGVRLFRNSGRFYFRVDSSFSRWTLKVVELTEEEAERYTPRDATARD